MDTTKTQKYRSFDQDEIKCMWLVANVARETQYKNCAIETFPFCTSSLLTNAVFTTDYDNV